MKTCSGLETTLFCIVSKRVKGKREKEVKATLRPIRPKIEHEKNGNTSEKLQMKRIWDWKRSEEIGLCQTHIKATNAKTLTHISAIVS